MQLPAFQFNATVLPGHRIELCVPELPEGAAVRVDVFLGEAAPKRRLSEILADQPCSDRPRTAEEVDADLRAERDSWDN